MPVPLPADLIERTAKGETVLFAGAGVSQPELPGWAALLEKMLAWAGEQQLSLGGAE